MAGTKADAERFAHEWAGKGDERQDTSRYWIGFYQDVLGVKDALSFLKFEYRSQTTASDHTGYADVYVPEARTIIEQKSLGIDLSKKEERQKRMVTPAEQARDYANGMPLSQRPRYVVTCNFAELWIYDMEKDPLCKEPQLKITLADLPKNLPAVQFLKGQGDAPETVSHAVSVQAGKIMGHLRDLAAAGFDDPITPESHHALSVLLTRLMFLMFCEDSGLIEPNAFHDFVTHYEAEDLADGLFDLFRWLDTPDDQRAGSRKLKQDRFRRMPYMNGGLFSEEVELPMLGEDFRTTLLVEGCQEFDWSGVSPTVFGSIFEGALSHDHRRANGQHFTSPENIHRVIDPLFLDSLEHDYNEACEKPIAGGARTKALRDLHRRLGDFTMLDPAAGSGNFLTESYVSLRRLENRVLLALADTAHRSQTALVFEESDDEAAEDDQVLVSLHSFHGIELEDYACCVARTALWIAEKQMDTETRSVTHRVYQELPLTDYEGIVFGNALRMDWNDVVPASEVAYICGNPPFLGASRCNKDQKKEIVDIFGKKVKRSSSLDYVSGWFYKTAEFMQSNPRMKAALVATNSITQGEQVYPIWNTILSRFGVTIDFAWRTFYWASEADDPAHVHCVIVGFSKNSFKQRKIFNPKTGETTPAKNISPYLLDAPDAIVESRAEQISGAPRITLGCKPTDGGNYIFTDQEKSDFLAKEPRAEKYFHQFLGSRELINGKSRWCMWLGNANPVEIAKMPLVMERVRAVRDMRLASSAVPTRKAADRPTHFFFEAIPAGSYIAIPEVSSQRRKYIQAAWLPADTLSSNTNWVLMNAGVYEFGVICSLTHAAWMRVVTGRLKSDYRYSGGVVYNNFVWPCPTPEQRTAIELAAQDVIDARKSYRGATLADLYDPDNEVIFPELAKAHHALDAAVEAAYGVDFGGDEERIVAHLFELYAAKMLEA